MHKNYYILIFDESIYFECCCALQWILRWLLCLQTRWMNQGYKWKPNTSESKLKQKENIPLTALILFPIICFATKAAIFSGYVLSVLNVPVKIIYEVYFMFRVRIKLYLEFIIISRIGCKYIIYILFISWCPRSKCIVLWHHILMNWERTKTAGQDENEWMKL